jgi:hypothetical protein
LDSAARLKKEKNQVRDIRLKAESAGKKSVAGIQIKPPKENGRRQEGKAKEQDLDVEGERTRLEERMERAMAAADEDESGDTGDEDSDILMREDDENSTVKEESDEEDSDEPAEVSLDPDYLPEHYFDQLGSSSKVSPTLRKAKLPVAKRKRKATDRRKREEMVIGCVLAARSQIHTDSRESDPQSYVNYRLARSLLQGEPPHRPTQSDSFVGS